MRYQVPQFIEVEDKIFGPLTFKQFIYLIGAAGVCFIAYKFFPLFIAVFIMLPAGVLGGTLALYRPNNRPFIDTVEAAFNYFVTSKLYIWKKEPKKTAAKTPEQMVHDAHATVAVPKISDSKLKDLTWSLDINETIYSRETGKLGRRKQDEDAPPGFN